MAIDAGGGVRRTAAWPIALVIAGAAASGCGDNLRAGADPDGGPGGDAAPPVVCDDQNPCTDDRVEAGACRFDPAEDGRPCDDGDFCTLGDRCQAGQCVAGSRSTGPLARLGTLDSLGGGAIGVVGDRFLAVTGPGRSAHVRLAERRAGGLETVAAWDGSLDAVSAADVIVQPLDGDLAVLGGRQERSLAIFSIPAPPAAIAKRGDVMLDGQLVSLTGRGHRIWACTRDFLRGFEVALIDAGNPDAPALVGSVPMPTNCGSIDASDDGAQIYVNTQDGVRFIDAAPLDTGGAPTLAEVFAPSSGVRTMAGSLLLIGASAVQILRQSDRAEVASIPVGGVLAASLAGARLLVEGWRTTASGGMEAYATLYDALGATPPAKLDEVVLQRISFQGDVGPAFRNAVTGDGSAVITGVGQRLFDLTAGRLDEVRTPALTPLDQLARTTGGVRAIGASSAAQIALDDPAAPRLAGGGALGIPARLEATLDESGPSPRILFGDRSDVPGQAGIGRSWEPDPLPIERWQLDGDGRPQVTGSFVLPNRGAAQLAVAGGGLYRMRSPAAPGFEVTVQGWPIAALGRAGELARPAFELLLSPSPPFDAASRSARGAFDVDPRARRAVVVTAVSSTTGDQAAVFWLDLSTTPPQILEQVRLDARADEVRVSGTRAVLSTHLELLWLELGKGLVARTTPMPEPFIEHLLGFDGRTVYYSVLELSTGLFVGVGAAVFGDAGPAVASIALDDTAQTMVEADGALVLGLRDQLVTVRPHCE
ncbi:MAG TPA: hypothetical protein VFT22_13860 [Kofleriaceae bacterium]|nr:hypothetical protein [Kofleriaceae bacterium]